MNLWFRMLLTLLLSRYRPRLTVTERCRTPFRVLPSDLDALVHVNNGKYFSLMDVARMDQAMRTGASSKLRRFRWYPLIVAETIQFYRALLPFQRFVIETQLIGWDQRSCFIRHRFIRDDASQELIAEAVVRAIVMQRSGGVVSMTLGLRLIGNPVLSEPTPQWVLEWANSIDAIRDDRKRSANQSVA